MFDKDSWRFLSSRAPSAAVPVVILCGSLWFLAAHFDPQRIAQQVGSIGWQSWLLALGATRISFWALGRYDAIGHRHFSTGVSASAAHRGGSAAIAIGQVLGLAVVTSALVRWRIFPNLGLHTVTRISVFVSTSFIISWCIVIALACVLLPAPSWTMWPAMIIIIAGITLAAVMLRHPVLRLGKATLRFPSWIAAGKMLSLTAVDIGFAALALFFLLPAGSNIPFAVFLPLFFLAQGLALISNTPGGVGPFELMLMALLPHVPQGDLLASIVAFRLVYYALPATLTILVLIRPARDRLHTAKPLPCSTFDILTHAARAEVQIIRQNGGTLLPSSDGSIATWRTGQTLTGLFDAPSGTPNGARKVLTEAARKSDRIPVLYKCSGRTALAARQAGWSVLHTADEAVLPMDEFDLASPSRRTLRRKLRTAQKAGFEVKIPATLPFDALARIDADWQARCGAALGGTMGRYCPDYVSQQWVAVGYVKNKPVAFVTFHKSKEEWCFDITRQSAQAPDGSQHALVVAAIEAARTAGASRVSLAANIACPDPTSPLWRAAARWAVGQAGHGGLKQFKNSFGPIWSPRFVAAPNGWKLALALADISREVHAPPPLVAEKNELRHDAPENDLIASVHAA